MILRPDFYVQDDFDPVALRREMGLREGLTTAIVLFGGHGSKVMYDITEKLDAAGLPLQLILICGRKTMRWPANCGRASGRCRCT